MALADEVQSRFKTTWIVELTNPNSKTATTVDTTYLALAVADVQAAFEDHAEVVYDGTNARHVAIACDGVLARLKTFSRTGGVGKNAVSAWDDWVKNRLTPLKNTTARARVSPVTTSQLTPSDEVTSGITRRPAFDESRLKHFQPGSRSVDDPYDDG